jgi:hypothetical protein
MKRIKKEGLTEEMMKTMGIKKCPQCKVGIEKNQGCNHISCKCGAHICWKCLRSFKDQHLCYDHLARGVWGDILSDDDECKGCVFNIEWNSMGIENTARFESKYS